MLSAIGLTSPTLKISLVEETLFLHPTPVDKPSMDPVVHGIVTLNLPKSRTVKYLTVKLVGKQDIGWPSSRPYESTTTIEREVSLFRDEDEETVLEKGEHTFTFSIIVPSGTAPYERCQFGRVRHFISAKAKGTGAMNPVIATAEHVLFLMVNPGGSGPSVPPPALDEKIEGVAEDLGPFTIALQSQNITVAGLLLFRFNFLSPTTSIHIHSLNVKILQTVTLTSALDPTYSVTPPADRRTVCKLDCIHPPNNGCIDIAESTSHSRSGSQTPRLGPMKSLKPTEGWRGMHLVRLPNDNVLRPSTQVESCTGLRISHEILVEVGYRTLSEEEVRAEEGEDTEGGGGAPGFLRSDSAGKGKGRSKSRDRERELSKKVLSITRPLDLHSCCCFLESLSLPVYAFEDPHPSLTVDDIPPCICTLPLSKLIELQGNTLMREEGEEGITYATIDKFDENGNSRAGSGSSTPTGRGREGRIGRAGWENMLRNALMDRTPE